MRILLALLCFLPLIANAASPGFIAVSTDENSSDTVCQPGEPTGAQDGDFIVMQAVINSDDGAWTDGDLTSVHDTTRAGLTGGDFHTYIGKVARGATAADLDLSYSGTTESIRCAAYLFRDTDGDMTDFGVAFSAGSHYTAATDDGCDGASPSIVSTNGQIVLSLSMCVVSSTFTEPSGYTIRNNDGGSDGSLGGATKAVTTSETPGAWTNTAGGAGDASYWTLAIPDVAAAASSVPAIRRSRDY